MVGTSPTLLFSAYFGALSLEQAAILSFPQGLPGFETEHRFAAIQIPDQHPLLYLQSVTTRDLCLLAFPVTAIDPGFKVELSAEDCVTLQIPAQETTSNLLALAIVAIEPVLGATANFAAPLVINLRNLLALQVLQPDSFLRYDSPLSVPLSAC